MAHVEKRGAGRWRARYRDPSGVERSKTFPRRAEAERFLAMTEADKAHGAWVDPAAGRKTFGEYARAWQQIQVHRATTADQVGSHLKNHMLPTFGNRPLVSVRPSQVQAWVKDRSSVLAPSTVEVVYRYLAAIFGSAVKDRLIAASPCVGVKLPRAASREVVPPTTEEVVAIADSVPPRYRALVVLAAGTGLRQGEALGLLVPKVDFLRRLLRVDAQLVLRARHAPVLAPPKTDASVRTIPLPDVVLQALSSHLAAFPAVEVEGFGPLMFTDVAGEAIRRNRFGEVWRAAVRRSGVTSHRTFHDLRHYYASLLIRHGESVKVVQRRLGHKTAQETLDTYGHLWPDSDDRTREAVDAELLGDRGSDPNTARFPERSEPAGSTGAPEVQAPLC